MDTIKKLKVIVFATGWACQRFIENCRDEYDILALSDWDEKKHDTEIQGIRIINPKQIETYQYDKIVIASQYVKEIKSQLKDRIGITEDKLLIPYKYQLKHGCPFLDLRTRSFARKMVIFLTDLLDRNNIPLILDSGTLLGVVRGGDLIEWDDDLDLSINVEHLDSVQRIIHSNKDCFPTMGQMKWKGAISKDQDGLVWQIRLRFDRLSDSAPYEFDVGIHIRRRINGQSVYAWGRYTACPVEYFESYVMGKLDNSSVKLPFNYEAILNYMYGNWRVPQKSRIDTPTGGTSVPKLDGKLFSFKEEPLF